ncbi:MAG TPA: secondary thiamine-phosphate synthase enzyme YjbQ, partial [Vicinamibacterales bacterium]|nr:secondary thiamine-phosphate synthase enzyme YjbQ [Vicinamibacterales bacterium]
EFIRITDKVADIVDKSGVTEGMVLVSAMHITAGVYVNDWEEGLIHDFQVWLEKLAPSGLDYRHHQTGEDNADAHLKRTIMGHQVIVPITRGKLDLGPWEQIFYAEFDGQRRKRVIVKVMGSNRFEVRSSRFEVRGSKFVVRSSTVLDPTDEAPQSLSLESARRISNPELRTWNRSNLEPLTAQAPPRR